MILQGFTQTPSIVYVMVTHELQWSSERIIAKETDYLDIVWPKFPRSAATKNFIHHMDHILIPFTVGDTNIYNL